MPGLLDEYDERARIARDQRIRREEDANHAEQVFALAWLLQFAQDDPPAFTIFLGFVFAFFGFGSLYNGFSSVSVLLGTAGIVLMIVGIALVRDRER